ncbi:MAG TPA: hypothetical protein VMS31_00620, partial [Pyrinomonadaceae bacterium]|nr:hypothetical protein [Pyrinomonadaceae bacterium]
SWFEQLPNSKSIEFLLSERIVVNGCTGSLLQRRDSPEQEVLVPDRGCTNMEYFYRFKKGAWISLGKMEDIK